MNFYRFHAILPTPPEKVPLPSGTVIPQQPSENQPQQEPGIMDPPQQQTNATPLFQKCDPPGTGSCLLWWCLTKPLAV